MLVSLAASSVLVGGVASAVFVATQAVVAPSGPTGAAAASASRAAELLAELHFAATVTERTATSVTVTVADRTGDGLAETVRYAWSGTAGDPLTRQYNGGTVAVFAADVHRFSLSYRGRVEPDLAGVPRNVLTAVRLDVQVGAAAAGRVEAATDLLNRPEDVGP
jgi:hypothetical protein